MSGTRTSRIWWTAAGYGLVGLGLVGTVLPGLPTTVFLIMALFCFKKGSERMEQWLLQHRRFGPTLREWSTYGSVSRGVKGIATGCIAGFSGLGVYFILLSAGLAPAAKAWIAGTVGAVALFGVWYVLARPTTPAGGWPQESDSTGDRGQPAELAS